MASEAQVLANRLNAQKSTGPRTPEGKAVVSQNALKHGLLAREVVIKGEDLGEFEFYRDQMLGELAPVGQVESVLAERVVSLSWRLQRAERLQGRAIDALLTPEPPSALAKLQQSLLAKAMTHAGEEPQDGDLAVGRVVVKDFSQDRVLDRLLMYERRIEHSLYRTMAELQRQRLLRELDTSPGKAVGDTSVWGERPRSRKNVVRGRTAYEEARPGVAMNTSEKAAVADAALQNSNIELHTSHEPLCETNPICPGSNDTQVPCGKEVMNDASRDGLGKTKPIPGSRGRAGGPPASPPEAGRTAQQELSGNGLFASPTIVYS